MDELSRKKPMDEQDEKIITRALAIALAVVKAIPPAQQPSYGEDIKRLLSDRCPDRVVLDDQQRAGKDLVDKIHKRSWGSSPLGRA
jgi:hypothetical protein